MNTKKWLVFAAVGAVFFSWLLNSAWGHAAIVWAYVENNQVHVEAFYASGKKMQNTKVVIVDTTGKKILEGKTDTDGKFSYKPLSKASQTVVVMAGESHVGDFKLSTEELSHVSLE